jgi:tetratricopeptide (TPR) repeat protein
MLDPRNADACDNRGLAYRAKGDHDHAIADYDQAIRLNPTPEAFNNRGAANRAKGDLDRAIADFDQAITHNPKHATALYNRYWARAIMGRQLEQAPSDCSESLRIRPNDVGTLERRGLAYLTLDRLDDDAGANRGRQSPPS